MGDVAEITELGNENLTDSSQDPLDVEDNQVSEASVFKDFYPVKPPFGFAGIQINDETGEITYVPVEPTLNELEVQILEDLKENIIERMDIPLSVLRDESVMEGFLSEQINLAFKRFKRQVAPESEKKFIYYLMRDFLGYGKIDLMMRDPKIEDISCNGVNTPLYVWHQSFESISTNIKYSSKKELDKIVTRLAYKAGHQISVAHPILEGTLPEGYRVHLTLDEVSKRGDTFTIRKFRTNPFTIVDLIKLGTLNSRIAAYLWVLVDNLRNIMICGATASGKTALLNSICTFINPDYKVVTIEEVRELRLHDNWIPMVTRPSFQPGVQEVNTFDLLKSSLRQRPDYLIVGEVRGEEAYTLFQSIATGHGGLCTIHADSIKSVIKRLLSRPMNVPEMMLSLMNVLIQLRRVKIGDQVTRRVVTVAEITGVPLARAAQGEEAVQVQNRFEWNVEDDSYIEKNPSDLDILLEEGEDLYSQISKIKHIPVEKLVEEQRRRETVLDWMCDKNISSYEEVADVVRNYYMNPDEVYNAARLGSSR